MPDPIRVLHFADIHVGMENYGRTSPETGLNSRVEDFLHRLDEMIAYARENEVDLIIFAGDAFKTRTPNPTFQREFAWRVRDLSQLAPMVMLVGNHDLPPMALKASSIEIYSVLDVPNVWVADQYEVKVIETKRGPVAVGAAPYPVRARLVEDKRTAGMTIAEIDRHLQEVMTHLIDELAEQADAQGDMPRILVGHFTVDGAVVGSERQIMLGRDIAVGLSALADPRWDYVALGHIHKHQNLTNKRDGMPPVVYSGSMERIDFGEEGDAKGFCWAEIVRGHAMWQFERVAARSFVTVRMDLKDSQTPTDDMIAKLERTQMVDAVVRVIVELTPDTEAKFNESAVRDYILRQGRASYLAGIRKDILQAVRARLGGSPEGLTDLELLERYFLTKQIDDDRRSRLLEAAQDVFDNTVMRTTVE